MERNESDDMADVSKVAQSGVGLDMMKISKDVASCDWALCRIKMKVSMYLFKAARDYIHELK